MNTDSIIAMLQNKVPKNPIEIQTLRVRLDKLDDKTRGELALEIREKIAYTHIKYMFKTIIFGIIFFVGLYLCVENEWLGRNEFDFYFDGFIGDVLDFISSCWKKAYDNPPFILIFGALCIIIGSIGNLSNLPSDVREANLKIINELILQKALQ